MPYLFHLSCSIFTEGFPSSHLVTIPIYACDLHLHFIPTVFEYYATNYLSLAIMYTCFPLPLDLLLTLYKHLVTRQSFSISLTAALADLIARTPCSYSVSSTFTPTKSCTDSHHHSLFGSFLHLHPHSVSRKHSFTDTYSTHPPTHSLTHSFPLSHVDAFSCSHIHKYILSPFPCALLASPTTSYLP